ncbi:unnamed protein product [Linum trigynum]|uniref:Uncharacterized protein n=1 Tax=Linum trigynum TaxID=586398 RepID=A0AAV2E3Q8_9ROSI
MSLNIIDSITIQALISATRCPSDTSRSQLESSIPSCSTAANTPSPWPPPTTASSPEVFRMCWVSSILICLAWTSSPSPCVNSILFRGFVFTTCLYFRIGHSLVGATKLESSDGAAATRKECSDQNCDFDCRV